jgi:hypothetical protein
MKDIYEFLKMLKKDMRAHLRAKGIPEDELEANLPTINLMTEEDLNEPMTVQMIPTKPRPQKLFD